MNEKTNDHTLIASLLPLYVSGAIDPRQRAAVEQHLHTCAECREDLALWQAMAAEIVALDQATAAPQGLAEKALEQVRAQSRPVSPLVARLRHILQLLRSQAPLVNREIWPATALVIGLGYVVVLVTERSGVLYALSPLIAATCVSLIYGPESDPAYELSLATPTSPRQILLARLALVFGYNLVLVLVATLGLLPMLAAQSAQPLLGELALAWLAPMFFLSAAALLLSLWIGSQNAIVISYIAWILQLFLGPLRSLLTTPQNTAAQVSPLAVELIALYQAFWQTPALLLALSALLFAATFWMVGKQESGLAHLA
jgi:hypothetical protein